MTPWTNNNNCFTVLFPGQPVWASSRERFANSGFLVTMVYSVHYVINRLSLFESQFVLSITFIFCVLVSTFFLIFFIFMYVYIFDMGQVAWNKHDGWMDGWTDWTLPLLPLTVWPLAGLQPPHRWEQENPTSHPKILHQSPSCHNPADFSGLGTDPQFAGLHTLCLVFISNVQILSWTNSDKYWKCSFQGQQRWWCTSDFCYTALCTSWWTTNTTAVDYRQNGNSLDACLFMFYSSAVYVTVILCYSWFPEL